VHTRIVRIYTLYADRLFLEAGLKMVHRLSGLA